MMLMLGMFAMHEYRGAAMEAHAVAALGPIPDWPTLYGIYGKVEPYTEQLRALEKFAEEAGGGRRTLLAGLPVFDGRSPRFGQRRVPQGLEADAEGLAGRQAIDEVGRHHSTRNRQAVAARAIARKSPQRPAASARAGIDCAGKSGYSRSASTGLGKPRFPCSRETGSVRNNAE